MKRAWPAAIALVCAACEAPVPTRAPADPPLGSVVSMGDARVEHQLLLGLYQIEGGRWRWAGHQFSLVLRSPPGAAERGAELRVELYAAPAVMDRFHEQGMRCRVNDAMLSRERWTTEGNHTYRARVVQLPDDAALVDCWLDPYLRPARAGDRELGAVVLSVGLYPESVR